MNKGLKSAAGNESSEDGEAPIPIEVKKSPWVLEVGGKATKLSKGIYIPRSKTKITKAGSSSLADQYKRLLDRNVSELVSLLENEEMMRMARQERDAQELIQHLVQRKNKVQTSFVKHVGDKVQPTTITSISEKAAAFEPSSILRSPKAA